MALNEHLGKTTLSAPDRARRVLAAAAARFGVVRRNDETGVEPPRETRDQTPMETPPPPPPPNQSATTLMFLLADVLMVVIAATAALFLTSWAAMIAAPEGSVLSADTLFAAVDRFLSADLGARILVLSCMTMAAFYGAGLYRRSSWEFDETRRSFFAGALVFTAYGLPTPPLGLALHGAAAAASAVLLGVLVTMARMALRSTPLMRRALLRPAILVGGGIPEHALINEMRESRGRREKILARMSLNEYRSLLRRAPDAQSFAALFGVHAEALTVLFAPNSFEMDDVEETVEETQALGLESSVALPQRALASGPFSTRRVFAGDLTLVDYRPHKLSPLRLGIKRAFDFTAALTALLLLSPILIGVMLALKMNYGWRASIFFSQPRVGKGRRRFDCWKFRTMAPDAQQRLQALLDSDPEARREWETYQKLSNDPRITTVGAILRKTSLDELPQLWNVLVGDMSLVGPRPIVAPEIPGYANDAAYYDSAEFALYAMMRPGVTGLWQVSGRASTAYSERIRLDGWYVRNWSLWLDALIIFKTVRAAILGSGAG